MEERESAATPFVREDPGKLPPAGFVSRWCVVVFISIGAGVQYTMRNNLSVAMTQMPAHYGWGDGWDGPLLSAFFVGYMLGQVPASTVAFHYGARRVLFAAVLCTGICNACIPFVARTPLLVALLRGLSGFSQAATFPTSYQLFACWTSPRENARVVAALHFFGDTGGTLVGFLASEQLLASELFGATGLQLVFWVWSVTALVWCSLWISLVPDRERAAAAAAAACERAAVAAAHACQPAETCDGPWGAAVGEFGAPINTGPSQQQQRRASVPWLALLCHPSLMALYANHAAGNALACVRAHMKRACGGPPLLDACETCMRARRTTSP